MSDFPGFNDAPRLNFVEEALGQHKLDPDLIQLYHAEAVEVAANICTEGIEKYLSGCLEYTRAVSRPVMYRDGYSMGLGLTAGPYALWDRRVVEIVELGLFKIIAGSEPQLITLAELKEDQVRTGGMLNPRINRPEDLDSFMRGLQYIAKELQ